MKIRERILVLLGLLSISFTSLAQMNSVACPPEELIQSKNVDRQGNMLYLNNVPGIGRMTLEVDGSENLDLLSITWRSAGIDNDTTFYCSYRTVDFSAKSRPRGSIILTTLSRGWRADMEIPNSWSNLLSCSSGIPENRDRCRALTA